MCLVFGLESSLKFDMTQNFAKFALVGPICQFDVYVCDWSKLVDTQ